MNNKYTVASLDHEGVVTVTTVGNCTLAKNSITNH